MISDELKQWNELGCTSRWLLELAKRSGKTIDRHEYVKRFRKFFPDPDTSCGYLDEYGFFKIIQLIGLPTRAETKHSRHENHERRMVLWLMIWWQRWTHSPTDAVTILHSLESPLCSCLSRRLPRHSKPESRQHANACESLRRC